MTDAQAVPGLQGIGLLRDTGFDTVRRHNCLRHGGETGLCETGHKRLCGIA